MEFFPKNKNSAFQERKRRCSALGILRCMGSFEIAPVGNGSGR
jgi:hypothetical protein